MLRSLRFLSLTCALALAACGGGDDPPAVDAPSGGDSGGGAALEAVTCPGSPDAMVSTSDGSFQFSPQATTISVGQTVQFVMSSTHDVKPNPAAGTSDSALVVNFGETKCFKFTQAGTYHFKCNPHGFAGTVTVQ